MIPVNLVLCFHEGTGMVQRNARPGRIAVFSLLAFVLGTLLVDPAYGERTRQARKDTSLERAAVEVLQKGSSSKSVRQAGRTALPLDKLSGTNRRRCEKVLKSLGLFRRLPVVSFEVDPETYGFFAAYPEVAVSIWRAMNISVFEMKQTGTDMYEINDGAGTLGTVEVLFRSPKRTIVLCSGLYKSPFLVKPISTTALIHLQTSFSETAEGKTLANHRADLFVSFPSQTVETAAKLISPISNMIVDRNFREVSLFVHLMDLAMQKQPGWVEYIAQRMEGVEGDRKIKLLEVTAKVYVAAMKRRLDDNAGRRDEITADRSKAVPKVMEHWPPAPEVPIEQNQGGQSLPPDQPRLLPRIATDSPSAPIER